MNLKQRQEKSEARESFASGRIVRFVNGSPLLRCVVSHGDEGTLVRHYGSAHAERREKGRNPSPAYRSRF